MSYAGPRSHSPTGTRLWTLLAAAGLCLTVPACQSSHKPGIIGPGASPGGASTVEPFANLKALSKAQLATPDQASLSIAPPPGINPADLAALEQGSGNAWASVDETVSNFPPDSPPASAASTSNIQAVRLYVSGRSKLLDGQPGKAVTDLEAATRLDPSAPQPWRELGEAQLALGRRTSAMASYEKAIKLGLDEPRLLDLLARDAMRDKHYENAARLLVQARAAKSISNEPGLTQLVNVDLAEALGALGYLTASRDLLAAGLSAPFEGIAQSRLRNELSEIYRRRGELWQRVGDISCRLGQYDKASQAYAAGAEAPTLDPGVIVARRVYADLRMGRSADAAMIVIDDIRQSDGRVEDRHMGVIRYLARSTSVGSALADAVADLSRDAGPQATPTVLNRLARASAAALSGDQARAVLLARLQSSPQDPDLFMDLLTTHPADDVQGTIEDCVRLVNASPLAADTYTDMIRVRGQSIAAISKQFASERSPAGRILAASMLTKLAEPKQALERLEGVNWSAELLPAAILQRATAAMALADWKAAGDAETRLAQLQGPRAARADALALESLQQFGKAYAAIAPLVADPKAASVDDLLLAADLSLRMNKPAPAETCLQAAVALDRYDERAHEALLSLYAPSGPMPNEAKLTAAIRSLHQSIASSRAIRGINAQDLIARSLWSQAQSQLLSLASDGNENAGVLRLLVVVWERAAAAEPELTANGEKWLRARLESRPESSALTIALAHVLVAQGKAKDADALLVDRMQAMPLPELARAREWVVRDGLDRPDEADQMARLRLEAAPPTIDNTIELAELLVKGGDVKEAAEKLTSGLPPEAALTGEQAARLVAILPKINPESIAKKDPASMDVAIRLFDLIAGRGTMTPQMSLTRLTLLATAHPQETDRLIAAIDQTLSRHPELFADAYQHTIDALQKLKKPDALLHFLGAASNHVKPPNEALYYTWYGLTCAKGDAADLEQLIDGITDNDRMGLLLQRVIRDQADDSIPATLEDRRADLARYAGDLLSNLGRDQLSMQAYRIALKHRANHAWAANNLGYAILDGGGDFAEATRLIEMAYGQLSEEMAVIDSMGWLRYKQGRLADVLDATGAVKEPGAITLLKHALTEMEDSRADPTIMDHAADAFWRTGDKDKAKALWLRAEGELRDEVRLAAQATDVIKQKIQGQLRSVQAKLAAVDAGKQPPVAPFAAKQAAAAHGDEPAKQP